jgi:type IV pilus assembly protein PilA
MIKEKGFTLIELMIVVSIIGILSSIALPAYQVYTKKAHVLEGINIATGAKSALWDYWAMHGKFPTDNAAAGLSNTITGNAVKSIIVSGNQITITYNSRVIDDDDLILTANSTAGAIQWNCLGGTVAGKYRPVSCR